MNDMFKHLEEMHEMLRSAEDIKSIESMIEVTKDTMTQHFDAYTQFKGQIDTITNQADTAISTLNFYEPEETKKE
jgi:hypothetical protein